MLIETNHILRPGHYRLFAVAGAVLMSSRVVFWCCFLSRFWFPNIPQRRGYSGFSVPDDAFFPLVNLLEICGWVRVFLG